MIETCRPIVQKKESFVPTDIEHVIDTTDNEHVSDGIVTRL